MSPSLKTEFKRLLSEFRRTLKIGGEVFIYGNGALNPDEYSSMLVELTKSVPGLLMFSNDNIRMHKWRRMAY